MKHSACIVFVSWDLIKESKSGMRETACKVQISSFSRRWPMERLIVIFLEAKVDVSRDVHRNSDADFFFFYIIRNGCAMILNGHIVYASSADSYQTWEEERGLIAKHKGFF